jgi:homoserine dehydrogenase
MEPTAAAVAGDLVDISRNILAGIGQRVSPLGFLDGSVRALPIKPIGDTVSRYYIRFSAVDRPGVLAAIAGALGSNNISIESMIQTGRSGEYVPIVIITHEATERDVRAALTEIDAFDIIREKSNLIRIEDNLE